MSNRFEFLFLYIFVFSLFFGCKKKNDLETLRFSNGVYPIYFDLDSDSARNSKNGNLLEKSSDCGTCHKAIFENWKTSRHSQAFTNPLYKQSHEKEPMSWCLNCHAPFLQANSDPKDPNQRLQSEDGVSCITCHVREGKILVSNLPTQTEKVHEYKQTELLASEEFCGNCHQFNFPDKDSISKKKDFVSYSKTPMQNTLEEWKQSEWYGKKNCQSCHLLPNTSKSHTFPGGHSHKKLEGSFTVNIERNSKFTYIVSIFANGIAHSFPTGDLFRSLRFRILTKEGAFLQEWKLGKTYEDNLYAKSSDAVKYLSKDDVFLPPKHNSRKSKKQFTFQYEKETDIFRYELFMDYVNPTTHVFGKLPSEITIQKFKSEEIKVSVWNGSNG
ncbi:multiheme c-type cytochrome [Leptospira venezuelensis]|uniref:multiheme c-type cytochrome n=1 Tax=Leptospira venezuelensis TaxID=1958811 RepID=UPI000A383071|nr:multiheme c-type cytochrome [Leptospira venezuelensis]